MDNAGLNSGNCILVTSGNISVKKSPCGSISFTCGAQMLYIIQLRFAQLQVAFFVHFSFSDRSFASAPSPIVLASSFVSIPSSSNPSSSSLLSSSWSLFLLLLWLLGAQWLQQLLEGVEGAWSMPSRLLWWAVSPFKQRGLERKHYGFKTWTPGTLCAPHPPICQRRQPHQGRSSHRIRSFGPSNGLLRRRHHLPKSKHQVHGIGLSQTREDY